MKLDEYEWIEIDRDEWMEMHMHGQKYIMMYVNR